RAQAAPQGLARLLGQRGLLHRQENPGAGSHVGVSSPTMSKRGVSRVRNRRVMFGKSWAGVASASALLSVLLGAWASTPPPPAQDAPAGAAPGAAAPSGAAAAAASATGPVKMLASAEARSLELATVSITSLDRLLTNGATLVAKAVPLPIDPSGLRDM